MRISRPLLNLRVLILLIVLSSATLFAGQSGLTKGSLPALAKLQGKITFVVLGDNRSGDDIYQKILAVAMERKPDFIINAGDQIETPGDIKEWAKFWEMSKIVDVPYFLTVGNHDVRDAESERIYKEQVDLPGSELYYSFTAGNSLFIVLDSYLTGEQKKIGGNQIEWLGGLLSNSNHKHKFVIVHHPLYPEKGKGKHHGNSLDRYPTDRDRLQALFAKYKVEMVFSGHEHLYLRNTVDGIQHIIAGGGGAPLYASEKSGGFHHYILVTIDGERVSAEVVDINGKVRDRF